MKWFVLMVSFLALMRIGAADAGKMVLVDQGVCLVPIIAAADAGPETMRAVRELSGYIKKISGASPRIEVGGPASPPPHAIWVGLQPELARLFPEVDFDFRHPEEILMACNGTHLVIAGRDRMAGTNQVEFGTANAVYGFLQKHLDVRWLWPGPLGEDVVRRERIALPAFEYRFHPPLRMRLIWRGSRGWKFDPQIIDWFRFQRLELMSARFSAGHSFVDWWEQYHEAHPEWFALRADGTRTPEKWGKTPNPRAVKLCVSNPKVAGQWLSNMEERLREDAELSVIGATPNDGGGFCTCTNCRAWDNTNGPPVWGYVALTDRYVRFWNVLARGLKARVPDRDVYLGAYAYSAYQTPPLAEQLEQNVVMAYVGHFPLTTDAIRQRQKREWQQWAESTTMMWYRPNLWYWSGGIWGFPEVAMKTMAEDFRFLAENHCVGLEVDGYRGFWATQGPAFYIMAQLTYDPYLDGAALMKDYYRRGFGRAAPQLEAYWTLMENARDTMVRLPEFKIGSGNRYGLPAVFQKIYTESLLQQADVLLQQAAAQVANGPERYRLRVAFVRDGLDYTRLMMANIPLMKRARESGGKDTAAVGKACENWTAIEELVTRAGVIALNPFGYVTRWVTGSGYMGGMQDYFGPPSEALRAGAESTPAAPAEFED